MKILSRHRGFTLIELVVVIALLGVLLAFAIPRFANLESSARAAVLQGLAGSTRSASTLAHAQSLVQGLGPNDPVQMQGAGHLDDRQLPGRTGHGSCGAARPR